MIDLKINDDFDLEFASSGDFQTATGKKLAEQVVKIGAKHYYESIIGTRHPDMVLYKVQMQTQRLASAVTDLATITNARVYYDDIEPDTLVIELTYDDEDTSTVTV